MKTLRVILVIFSIMISIDSLATHIRAGEIIARRIDNITFTYEFTFIGYRDTDSGIRFGGGVFEFGDGNSIDGSRDGFRITETPITGNIVKAEFKVIHTYQAPNSYIVSYREEFRNAGIANMDNSVNTAFYTETLIIIDPFFGVNNTPILTVPPIDEGIPGVTFIHNPGAFDIDGDSLSYEFTIPRRNVTEEVFNYREVIAPEFYTDYSTGSESGSIPTLTLDLNGNLTWDAPGDILTLTGQDCQGCADNCSEYNLAFRVVEWKNIDGIYYRLGYVTRDMQIIIYEGDNQKPELQLPDDVCVVANEKVERLILASDPDGDNVKIEAFGGPFELNSSAQFSPNPPSFQTSPGVLSFEWSTVCGHVRARPYEVQFKATDDPSGGECRGPSQVNFETLQIQVIGPKPTGLQTSVETGRSMRLDWDSYSCPNAQTIQIWRRVGDFEISDDSCIVGMPATAGYELIEEVPTNQTSYLDKGLAPGAKYCYRLVATFPLPGAGESIVSDESCQTLDVDAPVITNVDVVNTSDNSGIVNVRWTPPYEIDSSTFPPPYSYDVQRSQGSFLGEPLLILEKISDTTINDNGLDTDGLSFSYQIDLFDNGLNFVDVSAVASTVNLKPTPLLQAIELEWTANVPWSIVMEEYPYHYIYRNHVLDSDTSALVLIDSVDVTKQGFRYVDDGDFNDVELDEDIEYCYYVVTYGSYDNPILPEPLINRSQIACAQPNDNFAPCEVINVAVNEGFDCETELANVSCDFNQFENTIEWEQSFDPSCDDDAVLYRIYFSLSGLEEDFILLDSTSELFYQHTGLDSYKGCYKITAVDRSKNESSFSETSCVDNCPNFILPNVFTPNGDGINDTFTPKYSGSSNNIPDFDQSECPRFIKSVQFRVFDRTGKQVYDLDNEPEKSLLINWDGRTNDNLELPAGVYYYVAEVTFDVLETSESEKTYNGWVQILK